MSSMNFKSKDDYIKWLTYVKMHNLDKAKGNTAIKIKGQTHKVNHSK